MGASDGTLQLVDMRSCRMVGSPQKAYAGPTPPSGGIRDVAFQGHLLTSSRGSPSTAGTSATATIKGRSLSARALLSRNRTTSAAATPSSLTSASAAAAALAGATALNPPTGGGSAGQVNAVRGSDMAVFAGSPVSPRQRADSLDATGNKATTTTAGRSGTGGSSVSAGTGGVARSSVATSLSDRPPRRVRRRSEAVVESVPAFAVAAGGGGGNGQVSYRDGLSNTDSNGFPASSGASTIITPPWPSGSSRKDLLEVAPSTLTRSCSSSTGHKGNGSGSTTAAAGKGREVSTPASSAEQALWKGGPRERDHTATMRQKDTAEDRNTTRRSEEVTRRGDHGNGSIRSQRSALQQYGGRSAGGGRSSGPARAWRRSRSPERKKTDAGWENTAAFGRRHGNEDKNGHDKRNGSGNGDGFGGKQVNPDNLETNLSPPPLPSLGRPQQQQQQQVSPIQEEGSWNTRQQPKQRQQHNSNDYNGDEQGGPALPSPPESKEYNNAPVDGVADYRDLGGGDNSNPRTPPVTAAAASHRYGNTGHTQYQNHNRHQQSDPFACQNGGHSTGSSHGNSNGTGGVHAAEHNFYQSPVHAPKKASFSGGRTASMAALGSGSGPESAAGENNPGADDGDDATTAAVVVREREGRAAAAAGQVGRCDSTTTADNSRAVCLDRYNELLYVYFQSCHAV